MTSFLVIPMFLTFYATSYSAKLDGPVVVTSTGRIKGTTVDAFSTNVDAYLGIPYAQPPVGELRFRRPVPIKPWYYLYNASTISPPCYQVELTRTSRNLPDPGKRTEDCLYLNIWVPQIPNKTSKLKAMMVWIFGGGFNTGSADVEVYDGTILAAYGDVVVVTINFRVGALGYLYTNTQDATGNMALYDQVLALQWLNDNADAFGADKNEITLFGQSSGAMSIGAHLLSPLSENLFKRGILESGGALLPILTDSPTSQLKAANDLARIVQCADNEINVTSNPSKVIQCMQKIPVERISKAEGIISPGGPTFFPVHGDEFLPMDIVDYIKIRPRNKDILAGINEEEGALFLALGAERLLGKNAFDSLENMNKHLARTLARSALLSIGLSNADEIVDHYMKMNEHNTRKAIYDIMGDFLVACSSIFYVDTYSKGKENTYFYTFTYSYELYKFLPSMWTTHFMEVPMVFGLPFNDGWNFAARDRNMSLRVMDRWIAFAKTGNPNILKEIKWPRYSYEYPIYLNLDEEETLRIRPNHGRCEFWRSQFKADMNYTTLTESTKDNKLKSKSSSTGSSITLFPSIDNSGIPL